MGYVVAPISAAIALSQTPVYKVRPHTDTELVHHVVRLSIPQLSLVHFAYPTGMARLS